MAQVINPEGAGKERVHLARAVVVALRELMKQSKPDSESRDLAPSLRSRWNGSGRPSIFR